MIKYFITSDIHSFYSSLMLALSEAGFDINNKNHILCICGDAYDRGDETVQLFEFIQRLQAQNMLIYCKGNHEDLLKDCVNEIRMGRIPSGHHFSNGTVKTICQFCGQNEWIIYDPTWRDKICEIMQPVLDFIDANAVDYYEDDKHIFVHGWIPCKSNDPNMYHARGIKYTFDENWREGDWKRARWINGADAWNQGVRVDGKTIYCGHWHCSWPRAHIDHTGIEFDNKYSTNPAHRKADFSPWYNDGICCLDSCCVYSGRINVVVVEE